MFDDRSPVGFRPVADQWPISCEYGRKGNSWKRGYHPGVDFACKEQPVYAYQTGKVIFVGLDPQWGLYVKIEHKTGYWSYYCHLKEAFVVVGATVEQGHPIAVSGNSGVNRVTGEPHPWHCHFEVRLIATKEDMEPLFYDGNVT